MSFVFEYQIFIGGGYFLMRNGRSIKSRDTIFLGTQPFRQPAFKLPFPEYSVLVVCPLLSCPVIPSHSSFCPPVLLFFCHSALPVHLTFWPPVLLSFYPFGLLSFCPSLLPPSCPSVLRSSVPLSFCLPIPSLWRPSNIWPPDILLASLFQKVSIGFEIH